MVHVITGTSDSLVHVITGTSDSLVYVVTVSGFDGHNVRFVWTLV